MSGPTDWGDERPYERPSVVHVRGRTSRVAQVLLAFGAMILLAGAGVALTIVAARWASTPYPIAVFQQPLVEIVVQGAPERPAPPVATATATAVPSPTTAVEPTSPVPSPSPSSSVSVSAAVPTETPPVAP